jgi:hypothetical protein
MTIAGPYPCPFGPSLPIFHWVARVGLLLGNDGSYVRSLALAIVSCSECRRIGFAAYLLYAPLQGLMSSRYPGGVAFLFSPIGLGISPNVR